MSAVDSDNELITLDLTGPGSHVISIERGKVSFAFGPGDKDGRRVEAIVPAFVEVFNTLPDIGTIEREDVAAAVDRLAVLAPAHVTPELAQAWFDAARDF
jgi:hypothetical protein